MGAYEIVCRVYYEDTDAAGVVYYANYLNYFERCRSDWLRAHGFEARGLAERRLAVVVTAVQIDYLIPARLDDALTIGLSIKAQKGARLWLRQWAARNEQQLVAAEVSLACISLDRFMPCRWPSDLLAALRLGSMQ